MNPAAYTTFRSNAWRLFKSFCAVRKLPRTEHSFVRFLAAVKASRRPSFERDILFTADAHCLFLWKFRRIQHYFLQPGVADFCASAVKELSPEYSNALPFCPSVPGVDNEEPLQSGFALHFPAAERTRSLICIPGCSFPISPDATYCYYLAVADGDAVALLQRDSTIDADAEALLMVKTIFGFSLYINAFPDVLRPGAPGDVHCAGHYGGAHTIIGRAPVVAEEERGALTPHWRRGHFHLLTHPRYTHKRFQSVYVSGCFVRGAALEVDNDAPALKSA